MAKEQPEKATRRVKNPETFRERAIKASDDSGKLSRSARLKRAIAKSVAPIFTPIKRAADKVAGIRALRPLFKVLRFVGRIIFPRYFRDSWRELRQVTWPGWRESRRLTYAVLVFAIIFGASIAVVDYGLDKLFKAILLK
jgi:preprotein translocase SecE subunit